MLSLVNVYQESSTNTKTFVLTRDGSVVPVSRYREHFTEIP